MWVASENTYVMLPQVSEQARFNDSFNALDFRLDRTMLHDPVPALIGVGIVLAGLPLRRLLIPASSSSELLSQSSES